MTTPAKHGSASVDHSVTASPGRYPDEQPLPRRGSPVLRMPGWLRDLALVPVIVLVFVIGSVVSPAFLTFNNLVNNVLATSAVLGVVVVAESMIIIGGFFDLSLQAVVGFAPMLSAWLVVPKEFGGAGAGLNQFLALVVLLTCGAAIGAFNGLLVAGFKLNAFMVTLAMQILLQGFTLGISGGQTLTELPSVFTYLGTASYFQIPAEVWLAVVVMVGAALFMRLHTTGRAIYAAGGNAEAARAAGIKTRRLAIGLFVFGGVLAAVAGLMYTARSASVTATQGNDLIFTVFAAAVVGGIDLTGGRGRIVGAATGVLLLGLVQNLLLLSNVPSFWVNAVYGGIILGALLLGAFSDRDTFLTSWKRRRSAA